MPIALTRAAARELDRRAIEEHGIASLVLMENAGRACAERVLALRGAAPEHVLVLAGPGNNGGDGFVIARTLHNRGVQSAVRFFGDRARLESGSPDARENARLWEDLGGELVLAPPGVDAALDLAAPSVVVDALFGTGLDRPLSGGFLELVRAVNAARRPTLAVDLPSGLDADTGELLGDAIRATTTVTFVAPKVGFARGDGPRVCGEVVVAEIGIPRAYLDAAK